MGKSLQKANKNKTNVIIKMSNDMARSKFHTNNVIEARVIATLASLIHVDDVHFKEYSIPIKKFFPPNYSSQNIYLNIKKTSKNLAGKVISIETLMKNNKRHFADYTIFQKIAYSEGEAHIQCKFNPEMKDHLLKLKYNFAQIPLEVFLCLKSVYTQKLMTFLWSYKYEGSVTCELEDLCDRFNCANSYKLWTNFNRYLLKPGIAELNNLAGTNITYKPIKNGRKVAYIKFDLTSIPKPIETIASLEESEDLEGKEDNKSEIVTLLISAGINEKEAFEIEEKLVSIKNLDNKLEWLKFHIDAILLRYQKNQKNIKSPKGGYLYKALISQIGVEIENSKKDEKLDDIRNDIECEKIKAIEINKFEHKRVLYTLNAWYEKEVISEKERNVAYTYFDDNEFLKMYEEISEEYRDSGLSESEMYQVRARRLFEALSKKISN